MALTRKFLSALGVEEAKIDEIINAHTEVTDALKQERDSYKEAAEQLPKVKEELESLKAADKGEDKFKVRYEAIKEEFEQFKADLEAKETKAAKSDAYKALLKEAGIAEKRIDAVLRVSDIDSVELDKDGKIKGADKLIDGIKTEWADFIPQEEQNNHGIRVDFGGSLSGGKTGVTVDEIMAIEDDAQRQDAIAANHGLFGF